MQIILLAILIIFVGGCLSLFFRARPKVAVNIAIVSNLVAGIQILYVVYDILFRSAPDPLIYTMQLLTGPVSFQVDSLSAYFLLPTVLLATILAVFGKYYQSHGSPEAGNHWFFYNLLTASMIGVVVSANAMNFILFWELMSVAAFFLILQDDKHAEVKKAAWTFFAASHVSTAFIFMMFAYLGAKSGNLEFSAFSYNGLSQGILFTLFIFSLIGFGTKAGFFPMHIWLPEAHPAAPSHVSALMSGAMIKTGFYALFRFWFQETLISEAVGWIFVIGGIITGVFAIVTALAQKDIKRVLAYSSVENSGIIFVGIGAGILTRKWGMPMASACAFIGALLHILNHAIFKGLLFMGAGAVYYGSGARKLEMLGGLAKKIPTTAFCFLTGSVAIAALPPLNGFISEFLVFCCGLHSAASGMAKALVLSVAVLGGIALIGGIAIVCFTRTFALVFLGEPRSEKIYSDVHQIPSGMRAPMLLLVLACFLIMIFSPVLVETIAKLPAVSSTTGADQSLKLIVEPLKTLVTISLCLLVISVLLFYIRKRFFSIGDVNGRPTWDCGYAAPSSRMQYTSSSFAQPVLASFLSITEVRVQESPFQGFFPEKAKFESDSDDLAMKHIVVPPMIFIDRLLMPFRKFQHGKLHAYIAYIAIALLVLLIWKVGMA